MPSHMSKYMHVGHVTHGKSFVNMHASGNVYKMVGDQFVEEGRNIKEWRRKNKRERKERKKERENEKKGRENEMKGREKELEKEVGVLTIRTRRTKK